jgi:putative tryptophan/tyrosine transport system substrate-binding protein
MRRRDFINVVGGSVIAWPLSGAQQPERVRHVGVLHVIPEQASLGLPAFRKRLGELGYVEGQNMAIEYRWSDQTQRLPALAAELTGLKVDVIVTADTTATLVAKQATKDIPIARHGWPGPGAPSGCDRRARLLMFADRSARSENDAGNPHRDHTLYLLS